MVYGWAVRERKTAANPCKDLRMPSGENIRDLIVSVPDALKLVAAIQEAGQPDWEVALWATAFFSGLRRGELMGLDWAQIDLAAKKLEVVRSFDPGVKRALAANLPGVLAVPPTGNGAFVRPKSKKSTRTVGLPRLLMPYLTRLDRTEGLVFGHDGLRPFRDDKLYVRARRIWAAAGLDDLTLHHCRHTYASLMIEARVDISKVSEYMGHASVMITWDRYRHLLPDDLEDTMAIFDAYLDGVAST